jgi:hypothetical protein
LRHLSAADLNLIEHHDWNPVAIQPEDVGVVLDVAPRDLQVEVIL